MRRNEEKGTRNEEIKILVPFINFIRCVACGYETNADRNVAINIAAVGACLLRQGWPDTARPNGRTGNASSRPDGVKGYTSTEYS